MKLTIGQPGDKYEQQADKVAADIVQQNQGVSQYQNPVEPEQINQVMIQRCLNLDDPSWEKWTFFGNFTSYDPQQAKQELQNTFIELKDLISHIEESVSELKVNNFSSKISQFKKFIVTTKEKTKITYQEGQALLKQIKQQKAAAVKLKEEVATAIKEEEAKEQQQKEEEEKKKQAELERQQEEERQRQEEIERQKEEEIKKQAELKRQQEEKLAAEQEAQRQEEEKKKQEARKQKAAEKRRIELEEKHQQEAEKQKQLQIQREERRKRQEEEEQKRKEIEMKRQEERLKKQEEERKRQEAERKNKEEKIIQLQSEAKQLETQIKNKSVNDVTKELQKAYIKEFHQARSRIQGKDAEADQEAIEAFKILIPIATQIYNESESISANNMQIALNNSYINGLCNNLKQKILADKGISEATLELVSQFKKEVGKICEYYQKIAQLEQENNTIQQKDIYPPQFKKEANQVFTQLETDKNNYDKNQLAQSIAQFKRDHVEKYYEYINRKAKAEAMHLAYEQTVEGQFMQNPSVAALEKLVNDGEVKTGEIKRAYISTWDDQKQGEFSIECPLEIGQEQYRNVVIHVHCNSDGSAKDGNAAHFKLANNKYDGKTWELSKTLRDELIPSAYAMRSAGEKDLGDYLDNF
ncbi:MAG: hypothetical protein KME59_23900 [Trichormus sp. ATA11-4-KO1]|jgi:myosin heavy subunit|nr:hypothetical protein [Trichormus sp. ATA11-4-KO1]